MAKEIIKVFQNIPFADLPIPEQHTRFGQNILRELQELQVGSANNEIYPKIFRVDQQGQWMGQPRFVPIPTDTANNSAIRYQVDMLGNITATSFKTAADGQRIRMIDNRLESYDSSGVKRLEIDQSNIIFYNEAGSENGRIYAKTVLGEDYMYIDAAQYLGFAADNTLFAYLQPADVGIPAQFVFIELPALPFFATDPTPVEGAMYYNDTTLKIRVCEGGVWVNMI